MTDIQPGWYKDPADTSTQRYWDGEGWVGDPLPADVEPPSGPPVMLRGATYTAPPKTPSPKRDPDRTDPDASTLTPWPGTGAPGGGGPSVEEPSAGGPSGGAGPSGGGPTPGWPPGGDGMPPGALFPPGLIRRPAGAPAGFLVASPGVRLAARIIDIGAVLLLAAAANSLFVYRWWHLFWTYYQQASALTTQGGTSLPAAPDELYNLTFIILVVLTAVWFAYEVPSSANSGQTLGKRLVGIKVMRLESEERLGFGRSWRRWSRLGLPTLLWWCCGIGLVIQLLDCFSVAVDVPLHQALHDKAAATVVVRTRRPTNDPAKLRVGGTSDRSDAPRP